ncbi:ferredoxin reductase family protein [Microvirga lenta]|uniref:ferredoxin reductase family protein n=1 Tax=Microvirga lenta TaxID=2881337 RepID=UPI001CFF8F49|nr:ferric reductase-like transmembrane domain-containing protein [Microvirga lenta]MCB5177531.1 ferric reductase-like transmembrane domain-containing protein [Microvirga lenta]
MALGFAGMAVLGIQFALTARFKRISAPFGIDIIYLFHRYMAITALMLVLMHFGILWWSYADVLGSIDPRKAPWELTSGRVALVAFILAVVTSEWRKPLRLEYGIWRFTHVVLATIGFAAAVAHIVGIGYYTEAPGKRWLWLVVTLLWVFIVVWVRIVRPWSQLNRPYRVAEVREERNEAWTLVLQPDGHSGMRGFKPGQFGWLTLRSSPFRLSEHPFSLASAPEQLPRVELGIKALGDFTESIGDIKPGEIAYLDAPYGVFSIDNQKESPGFVYIVGGIGVTPCMSMLRSMAQRGDERPLWLFYANANWDGVTYREEIERLAEQLNLKVVHILEHPPGGWKGEEGFISRDVLDRHLPENRAELYYFLCGPAPMIKAAEEGLCDLQVPLDRIQTEVFELV